MNPIENLKEKLLKFDYKKNQNLIYLIIFSLIIWYFLSGYNRETTTGNRENPVRQELENKASAIPDYDPNKEKLDTLEQYENELVETASLIEYSEQVELLNLAQSYINLAGLFVLSESMKDCYGKSNYVCLVSFWSGRINELEKPDFSNSSGENQDNQVNLSFEKINSNRQKIVRNYGVLVESKALMLALILSKEPVSRTEKESIWLERTVPLYVTGRIDSSNLTPDKLVMANALTDLQNSQKNLTMTQGELNELTNCLREKSRNECINITGN